ncbi:hypothetical protein K457DRAFT_36664 [Linnemannia elongata AG-77]|uniref:Uncharacterized protein n=1 Tax=Linnemannia elongata AG-77 TaxID=1314771 RepID=A0A197JFX3_9FUNG|nr:hypothetical protein K457DRAFT_36664 [Linnemannia elongata AG-77]
MAKTPKGHNKPSSEPRPPIILRDGTQVGSNLPSHFPKGKASSTRRAIPSKGKPLDSEFDKTEEESVEGMEEGEGGEEEDYNGDINMPTSTTGYPTAQFLLPQRPGHFPFPQEYLTQMANYPHSGYSFLSPPQPHSNSPFPYTLQHLPPQQLSSSQQFLPSLQQPLSSPYQFQFTPQQPQPNYYTTATVKKGRPKTVNNTNQSNGNSQFLSPATPLEGRKGRGKAVLHNQRAHNNNTSNKPSNSSSNDSRNDFSKNNIIAHDPHEAHHDVIPEDVAVTYHDPSLYDPNTSNGLIKKKIAKIVPPVPTIADAFKNIATSPANMGTHPVSPSMVSAVASAPTTHVDPSAIPQLPPTAVTASAPDAPNVGVDHFPIPTTGQPPTAISQSASSDGNGGSQYYTVNNGAFFSIGGDLPSQYEDKSGNTVLSCRHHWGFKGHRLCQGTDAQDYNCLICLNKAPLGNVKPWNARCLSWKINAPNPLPAFDCCPFIRAVRRQRCILGIFPTGIIPADFLAVWKEWCKSKSATCATMSSPPALASDNSTHCEDPSSSCPSKSLLNGERSSTKRPHVVEQSSGFTSPLEVLSLIPSGILPPAGR